MGGSFLVVALAAASWFIFATAYFGSPIQQHAWPEHRQAPHKAQTTSQACEDFTFMDMSPGMRGALLELDKARTQQLQQTANPVDIHFP